MSGVLALNILVLPQMLANLPVMTGRPAPPVSLTLLLMLSTIQSAVLVALAVWIGSALAPALGLHAPAFEAFANHDSPLPALKSQTIVGLFGGIFGGLLIAGVSLLAPPELKALQKRFDVPVIARVLYGGFTEEILLRWGVMTLLLWIAWRGIA